MSGHVLDILLFHLVYVWIARSCSIGISIYISIVLTRTWTALKTAWLHSSHAFSYCLSYIFNKSIHWLNKTIDLTHGVFLSLNIIMNGSSLLLLLILGTAKYCITSTMGRGSLISGQRAHILLGLYENLADVYISIVICPSTIIVLLLLLVTSFAFNSTIKDYLARMFAVCMSIFVSLNMRRSLSPWSLRSVDGSSWLSIDCDFHFFAITDCELIWDLQSEHFS